MSNLSIKYRPDIDGLRAIAILPVIIFHFASQFLPGGFVGVDIFFTISGFLITKIILRENRENNFTFSRFYERRIRRIFPALFTMFFFSYVAAFLILASGDMLWFARTLHYATLQISNFFFQRTVGYFEQDQDPGPLLHTWSLAVEEQFYLLMPLLLFMFFALKKKYKLSQDLPFYGLLALSLISLVCSQILVFLNQKMAFYSIFSRFFELGIGCIAAFDKFKFESEKSANAAGACGIFAIILSFFVVKNSFFPGVFALLPCLGTALIIISANSCKTAVSTFLSNKLFVFIGKISYSLYLWHMPLLVFYGEYTNEKNLTILEIFCLAGFLFLISCLSWRFVELPFRRPSNAFSAKKVFTVSALCIAFFITISTFAKRTEGLRFRFSDNVLIGHDGLKEYASFSKAKLCGIGKKSHKFPENIEDCVIGENSKNFEAILFGDSHAGHFSIPITNWANRHNLSMSVMYLFACPPLLSGDFSDENSTEKCVEYRQRIWKILSEREHIKYVFLASSWHDDGPLSEEKIILSRLRLEETVKKIVGLNKKLIILSKVPSFASLDGKQSPLKCAEKNSTLLRKIASQNAAENCTKLPISAFGDQIKYLTMMQEVVAKYKNKGVYLVDPFAYFCDKNTCSVANEKALLYSDKGHLNAEGAKYLIEKRFLDELNLD